MSSLSRYAAPLFAVGGVALGLLLPGVGQALTLTIPIWLGVIMYYAALQMGQPRQFFRSVRPGLLLLSLLAIFLGIPGLMLVLSHAAGLAPTLRAGLVVVSAAPVAIGAPYVTRLSTGDVDVSIVLSAVSHLVAPVVVPAVALLFLGVEARITFLKVATTMTLVIATPTALALLLKRVAASFVARTRAWEGLLSSLMVAILNWVFVGVSQRHFLTPFAPDTLILLGLAFVQAWGLYYLISWFAMRFTSTGVSKALAASLGLKNVALIGGAAPALLAETSLAIALLTLANTTLFVYSIVRGDKL
jgi:BASS family bile acid:Na+ symporter